MCPLGAQFLLEVMDRMTESLRDAFCTGKALRRCRAALIDDGHYWQPVSPRTQCPPAPFLCALGLAWPYGEPQRPQCAWRPLGRLPPPWQLPPVRPPLLRMPRCAGPPPTHAQGLPPSTLHRQRRLPGTG